MAGDIQKLLISALMSLALYSGTEYWYRKTAITFDSIRNEAPIAYVESLKEGAKRKPAAKTLWLPLSESQELFSGEYVKTGSESELRIHFVGSDRFLDLEADSQVLLMRTQNEIALNLEKGSIMVSQTPGGTTSGGTSLTLQSGKNKVDLSTATAMLSKDSDMISLQVLKGKAQVESESGKSQEIGTGKMGALDEKTMEFNPSEIEIISPSLGETQWINASQPQSIQFAWKGFPEKSKVSVWMGPQRNQLRAQSSNALQIPQGKYYWKLVATDSSEKVSGESPIYPLEVKALPRPMILSPKDQTRIEILSSSGETQDVNFAWSSALPPLSTVLELASSPNLSEKIITQKFANESTFLHKLGEGTYYWRLTSYFKNIKAPVTSSVMSFTVAKKPVVPVIITWQPLQELSPQYFVTESELNLRWLPDATQQTKSWRLTVATDENSLRQPSSAITQELKETSAKVKVPSAGRYVAMIEALDDKNKVLATSPLKTVQLASLPLLPSPTFINTDPTAPLTADKSGNVELSWSPVKGAKEYLLKVSGAEPIRVGAMNYSLRDLAPGNYELEIRAVDEFGRESIKGKNQQLEVPNESSVQAPVFRKTR